jgi:Arginine-tRNA-protein transferase, N terminus
MFSLTEVVEDWDDIFCKACNPEAPPPIRQAPPTHSPAVLHKYKDKPRPIFYATDGRKPSAVTFLSPVFPCVYLPHRIWRFRYELVPHLRPADYMQRLQQGWRPFGGVIYRQQCPSCQMCQSLRVPVATFRPNRTQRRVWKRNQGEVTVRVGAPSYPRDRLDLWERFHRHGHETKGWPARAGGDLWMMVEPTLENPFPTEEWTYYVGNRLIAVALCGCIAPGPRRELLLLRPNGGDPFAGDVQHPVTPRLCSRAGTPARLPRFLRSGMSIIGIQAQVSPERSAPAQWNMRGVQRLVT